MLDPSDGKAWVRALAKAHPLSKRVWTFDGRFNPEVLETDHVFLGSVGIEFERFVMGKSEVEATADEWHALLAWVEANFPGTGLDDSYVENLVAVSFVEEWSEVEPATLLPWLPSKLRAEYLRQRAWWDGFMEGRRYAIQNPAPV